MDYFLTVFVFVGVQFVYVRSEVKSISANIELKTIGQNTISFKKVKSDICLKLDGGLVSSDNGEVTCRCTGFIYSTNSRDSVKCQPGNGQNIGCDGSWNTGSLTNHWSVNKEIYIVANRQLCSASSGFVELEKWDGKVWVPFNRKDIHYVISFTTVTIKWYPSQDPAIVNTYYTGNLFKFKYRCGAVVTACQLVNVFGHKKVSVNIPSDLPLPGADDKETDKTPDGKDSNKTLHVAVGVSVAGCLAAITFVVLFLCCRSRKLKNEKKEESKPNPTQTSNPGFEMEKDIIRPRPQRPPLSQTPTTDIAPQPNNLNTTAASSVDYTPLYYSLYETTQQQNSNPRNSSDIAESRDSFASTVDVDTQQYEIMPEKAFGQVHSTRVNVIDSELNEENYLHIMD